MSIHSSSRRAAAGRPTLALGITLALLIGLFAPVALFPRSGRAAGAVTTTDLNLRAGPGLDRHVKLVMPPGAPVDLLSGLGDLGFYKVAYQGVAGYAWGEYVDVGGGGASGDGGGVASAAGNAVASDALNFRSGPGTGNRVLDVIPRGGAVTLTGESRNGFASARYAGEQGWVAEAFLELTEGDRDDDSDPGSGDAGAAYTTTALNLRDGPSLADDVILVMPPAAEVTLTGREEAGFAGVRFGDTRGWASAQYLSDSTPETSSEPRLPADGGGDVVGIIYAAAAAYGQDGNALLAVAQCESGLNPGAYNASSAASGLFQFLPGTWATTPYAGSDIFDPWANANAAAWMWSVGRRGEWVC